MSLNNVIPAWVLILEQKEESLSTEDFIQWLYSDEADNLLPVSVRYSKIQEKEMELWNL